eukprot:TRINITY_DN21222_c0_g1_i1.p1 TRINITY_DN21222_c0_g1~~TRINITY_DN21222_c0_g1_i1.p1  ORF type:complete len:307 (-),score=54.09 TRINITY_DN21222_c0_g1_i1:188-1051(-)
MLDAIDMLLLSPCGSGCLEPHWEVAIHSAAELFNSARPIGRLACVARAFQYFLSGGKHRKLKVGEMHTGCIQSLSEGLRRVNLSELRSLSIDLSAAGHEWRTRQDIERAVRNLSCSLREASSLQALSVRMAAFDNSMERLRLSADTWGCLVNGLFALAGFGKLKALELSSFTIKEQTGRQLRRAVSSPESESSENQAAMMGRSLTAASPSFTQVISRMSMLDTLTLTSDEIYPSTACLLSQSLAKLVHLKTVDLSRNHITQEAMNAVHEALPATTELRGVQNQTVFC